jgi:hypothetical protein
MTNQADDEDFNSVNLKVTVNTISNFNCGVLVCDTV